jgi:hypothetical protein
VSLSSKGGEGEGFADVDIVNQTQWPVHPGPLPRGEEKHLGAFVVYGPNARQPGRGGFRVTGYNCEWVPSQKGIPLECLQAHQATVFASVISVFVGPRPVPLCDPSQNGWLFERPQAHHQ